METVKDLFLQYNKRIKDSDATKMSSSYSESG